MKRLTMFIKNSFNEVRSAKYEVRSKNEVRSAEYEVRNVNEIRNDSSLRGTKQSLQLFFLRLPRFARNDVIFKMRSAECEVRNVNEIRNDSSLRGTKQSPQLFFLRLPRFARNDAIFKVRSAKYEVRNKNEMRSAEYEVRSKIKENRNIIHTLSFILHTLYFILLSSYCNAQTILDSSKLVSEFTFNAKFVQADDMGNLYIVSPTNQLYKYNYSGKVLATLNYNYNGNISSLDVSNPMEIYIFYKEINRVLLLDNNLAYRGELDLTKLNITQAAAIARSFDNGIWVFDLGDLQLKKITKDGILSQSSGNIKQFTQTDFIPNLLSDNTNQIMLCNDSVCLLFDVFAAYIKTIKFKNSQNFQFGNNQIFETNQSQINSIDLKMGIRNIVYTFPYFQKPFWTYINKENVILFTKNIISVYRK